jgi:PTS system cellobiose-specific IIB component
MQKEAEKRGVDAEIWAVAEANAAPELEKADCMLIGPQVRFLLTKMQALDPNKPVQVIDMATYGMMDGSKVLDQALTLLGKN